MELANTNMWMIRAGQDGHALPHFLGEGIAYLGWGATGVIHPETTRAELRSRVARADGSLTPTGIGNATRCIWEFCCEVQVGDAVVTYEPQQRLYHVGIVRSNAEHGNVIWGPWGDWGECKSLGYIRKVDWVSAVPRDSLSATARNSLGRPPTHFQLPAEVSEEIRGLCA